MTKRGRRKQIIHKIIKSIIVVLVVIALSTAIYNLFLSLSTNRLEDNLEVAVQGEGSVSTGLEVANRHVYEITCWDIDHGTEYSSDKIRNKAALISNIEAIAENLKSYMSDFVMLKNLDEKSSASNKVDEKQIILDTLATDEGSQVMSYVYTPNYTTKFLLQGFVFGVKKAEKMTGESVSYGINNSGLMTLSKLNMTKAVRYSLQMITDGKIQHGLVKDKSYLVTYIPTQNGKNFVLVNAELSKPNTDDEESLRAYSKQIADLTDFLISQREVGNYVVCACDFNISDNLMGGTTETIGRVISPGDNTGTPFIYKTEKVESVYSDDFVYEVSGEEEPDKKISDFIPTGYTAVSVSEGTAFITTNNIEITGTKQINTDGKYSDKSGIQMRFILD